MSDTLFYLVRMSVLHALPHSPQPFLRQIFLSDVSCSLSEHTSYKHMAV